MSASTSSSAIRRRRVTTNGIELDLLEAGGDPLTDDTVPAWCDCGPRTLSRVAMLEWIAAGEHRVVVD